MTSAAARARRLAGWLAVVIGLCGAYALLVGTTSFAGWMFDVPRLASWDGAIGMQPNTALAATLAGIALLAVASGVGNAAAPLGLLLALLGAATIVEHLGGVDFGIDRIFLFDRPWGGAATRAPGRMGPPASASLLLTGVALIALRVPRWRWLVSLAGMGVATLAGLSLIGYLFGADTLYTVPAYTAIALQTATVLAAVAGALFAAVPEREPVRTLLDEHAAGVLVRRTLPFIILLPLVIGYVRVRGQELDLYDTGMGTALLVVPLIALLCSVLWWGAEAVRRHQGRIGATTNELRRSEERFRLAADAVNGIIYELDLRTGTIERTRGFQEVVGYRRDDVPPTVDWWLAQVHPEDRVRVAQHLAAESTQHNEVIGLEYRVRHRGGHWLHLDDRSVLMEEADGRRSKLIGCALDVTAQRVAEGALRESEERFRSLAEAITSVVWTANADGRFVTEQVPWHRYTGQAWEAHRGTGWLAALHPDERDTVAAAWAAARAARERYSAVWRVWHTASGAYRHVEARAVPLHNADGSVREWVGKILDVEDRFRTEEELRRTAQEREELLAIAERARAEAEGASRAKDEFLAMLGHELRNPLAAVRNAIATLSLDRRRREDALEIARRQVQQLGTLVDDLLDVARITQGRITLRRERLTLQAVLERALDATRAFLEARGQHCTVDVPEAPLRLEGDAARLEQVLVNLLSNAAKYSDPGGHIRVALARQDGAAVIRVRDTGIGIPPELLARVFDLFTQADRSLDRIQGGLGIGLTVARRLIELHNGRIEAFSDGPGTGSEFVITLPGLIDAADVVPAAVLATVVERRPTRVLLVEDNEDAAESLRLLLEVLGHRVRVTHNGADALEAARANPPDLMLVDIGLPGIDGYEVARRVRRDPLLRALTLVALTGYGQAEDRQRALAAGFDHHLVKPVEPERLEDIMVRLGAEAAAPPDQSLH